ncbi:hypothetical protein GCM10025868_14880 [Angustibacter aerolatus]|uniref:Peptidyl-tRNA hydrolase n=1 Tax=Angustibacter aerolatus TaxID=1162965 RepID=A0ABQ6JFM9_9ACTN|nr:hypothetical protein GCM10025868_14880 [Angustibacter aerolatus]
MSTTGTWLVVGLGNPGPAYAGNRHNVGAMVVDVLAARTGGSFKSHRSRAAVLEGRLGTGPGGVPGPRVVLAKPATYMNESGGPVAGLAQYYDVEPERVVVVHDEPRHRGGEPARRSAAARAATTACARSAARSAPRTTCGCGSASGDRPAGRTPPTSC